MKTEPTTFSIDDLAAEPNATTGWDSIRNYQARNFMRDEMRLGDQVLLYHSSCAVPGIVGIMEVVGEARPDPTALDPDDPYFDPKSDPDAPRWVMVDVQLVETFDEIITLESLREVPELTDMQLLRRGNRLSVMPVTAKEFKRILKLR
jgi:predicted RNA-binding protein with PUA-like domain